MGLVVAAILAVLTLLLAAFVTFGDMMSDNPGDSGTSPFPILFFGFALVAFIVYTHFYPIGW